MTEHARSAAPSQSQAEAASGSPVRAPLALDMPTPEELHEIELAADREHAKSGIAEMGRGAMVFVIGLTITLITYASASQSGGGIYVIAYGAVFGGAADFIIGFGKWKRGRKYL